MKTRAAVLHDAHKPFEIMELDLDGPGAGEVLIRYVAAGLCHSDLHLTEGDLTPRFPVVGGHEGAGIIEEVGPGVTKVKPGDHVVCSFIPNCGICRYCATGHSSLCDMGATILEGSFPDGSFRFHSGGTDYGQMCMLGTFAEYATISQHSLVKVSPDAEPGDGRARRVRRADRLGHRRLRGQRAGRGHRGDLRDRRHRDQRGPGRRARRGEERGRGRPAGVQAGDGAAVRRDARVRLRRRRRRPPSSS